MSYSVLTTNALNMPPQLCAIAHDGRISAFSSIFPFPFFFLPLSQPVTTRCGQGNWGLTCATNRVRRLSPEVPNVRRFTICSPGQGDSYRPPVSRTAPTRAGNIYMCHYLHPCGPPPRRRGGIVAHDDRRPHGCRLNWRGVTDQSGVLMFPFRPNAVRARRWIAREALCHRSAAHRGRIVTDIATCMQLRLSTLTTGSTGSRQQWHRTTSSGVSSAAASGFPSASGEFSASPGAARRRLPGTAFACDRALRVPCLPRWARLECAADGPWSSRGQRWAVATRGRDVGRPSDRPCRERGQKSSRRRVGGRCRKPALAEPTRASRSSVSECHIPRDTEGAGRVHRQIPNFEDTATAPGCFSALCGAIDSEIHMSLGRPRARSRVCISVLAGGTGIHERPCAHLFLVASQSICRSSSSRPTAAVTGAWQIPSISTSDKPSRED